MRRAMFSAAIVGRSRRGVAFTGGPPPKNPKDLQIEKDLQILLASGVGVASLGVGVGSLLIIFTPLVKIFPFWLPMVGAFVPLLWLSFAPAAYPNLKLSMFLIFCFLEGMAMSASNTP